MVVTAGTSVYFASAYFPVQQADPQFMRNKQETGPRQMMMDVAAAAMGNHHHPGLSSCHGNPPLHQHQQQPREAQELSRQLPGHITMATAEAMHMNLTTMGHDLPPSVQIGVSRSSGMLPVSSGGVFVKSEGTVYLPRARDGHFLFDAQSQLPASPQYQQHGYGYAMDMMGGPTLNNTASSENNGVSDAEKEIFDFIQRFGLKDDQSRRDIAVKDLRHIIPMLIIYCFGSKGEPSQKKVKGLWDRCPQGWPADVPYLDPNNAQKSKGEMCKPKKETLVKMFTFLMHTYWEQRRGGCPSPSHSSRVQESELKVEYVHNSFPESPRQYHSLAPESPEQGVAAGQQCHSLPPTPPQSVSMPETMYNIIPTGETPERRWSETTTSSFPEVRCSPPRQPMLDHSEWLGGELVISEEPSTPSPSSQNPLTPGSVHSSDSSQSSPRAQPLKHRILSRLNSTMDSSPEDLSTGRGQDHASDSVDAEPMDMTERGVSTLSLKSPVVIQPREESFIQDWSPFPQLMERIQQKVSFIENNQELREADTNVGLLRIIRDLLWKLQSVLKETPDQEQNFLEKLHEFECTLDIIKQFKHMPETHHSKWHEFEGHKDQILNGMNLSQFKNTAEIMIQMVQVCSEETIETSPLRGKYSDKAENPDGEEETDCTGKLRAEPEELCDLAGSSGVQLYVRRGERMQECSFEGLMQLLNIQVKETPSELKNKTKTKELIAKEHSYMSLRKKKPKKMRPVSDCKDKLGVSGSCKDRDVKLSVEECSTTLPQNDREMGWEYAKELMDRENTKVIQPRVETPPLSDTRTKKAADSWQSAKAMTDVFKNQRDESSNQSLPLMSSGDTNLTDDLVDYLDRAGSDTSSVDVDHFTSWLTQNSLAEDVLAQSCQFEDNLSSLAPVTGTDFSNLVDNLRVGLHFDGCPVVPEVPLNHDDHNSFSSTSSLGKFLPPDKVCSEWGESSTFQADHAYSKKSLMMCKEITDPTQTQTKIQEMQPELYPDVSNVSCSSCTPMETVPMTADLPGTEDVPTDTEAYLMQPNTFAMSMNEQGTGGLQCLTADQTDTSTIALLEAFGKSMNDPDTVQSQDTDAPQGFSTDSSTNQAPLIGQPDLISQDVCSLVERQPTTQPLLRSTVGQHPTMAGSPPPDPGESCPDNGQHTGIEMGIEMDSILSRGHQPLEEAIIYTQDTGLMEFPIDQLTDTQATTVIPTVVLDLELDESDDGHIRDKARSKKRKRK